MSDQIPPEPDKDADMNQIMAFYNHPVIVERQARTYRRRMRVFAGVFSTLLATTAGLYFKVQNDHKKTVAENMPAFVEWSNDVKEMPLDSLVLNIPTIFDPIKENYFSHRGIDTIEKKLKTELPKRTAEFNKQIYDEYVATLDSFQLADPKSYQNLLVKHLQRDILEDASLITLPYDFDASDVWHTLNDKAFDARYRRDDFFSLMSRVYDAYFPEEEKTETIEEPQKVEQDVIQREEKDDKLNEVTQAIIIDMLATKDLYDYLTENTIYPELAQLHANMVDSIYDNRDKLQKKYRDNLKQARRQLQKENYAQNKNLRQNNGIPDASNEILLYARAKFLMSLLDTESKQYTSAGWQAHYSEDAPDVIHFTTALRDYEKQMKHIEKTHTQKQEILARNLERQYETDLQEANSGFEAQDSRASQQISDLRQQHNDVYEHFKGKYQEIATQNPDSLMQLWEKY